MIGDDQTEEQLERYYNRTWMCSKCGRRHLFTFNVCEPCLDEALDRDAAKLAQLMKGSS